MWLSVQSKMNWSHKTVLLLSICITVIHFSQAMSQTSTKTACTRGFIQSALLQKRAEKIASINTIPAMNLLNNGLRVFNADYRFICSGVLTSLLLGVDVRTVTKNRNRYPEVQVWRINAGLTPTRVARQKIRLTAGDFSPDGVLRYNLTPSIPFRNGDFLAVYQPPAFSSVVRLFFAKDPNASSSNFSSGDILRLLQIAEGVANQRILLSPITDPLQCRGSGFLTPEALRQKTLEVNINRVVVRDRQQRVFPDISFTCNGSITKWIVGVGTGGSSSPSLSELQIWRRSGADSYTKVASTQLTAQSPINNSNVYEYVPSLPLGFQEGDVLGVYQREGSSVVPYYQESTGPVNLRELKLNTAPDSLTTPPQAATYDYPLVTVEIGSHNSLNIVPSNSTATLFQASSSSYSSISTFSTSFTSTEVTMVTIVLPTSSVPTSSSTMGQERNTIVYSVPTSSPTMEQETNTSIAILASIISVLLAVVMVLLVAIAAVFIKWERIHKNPIQHPVDVTTSDGKEELQDNISRSTTEHVGDPHDKPLFGEDPPIILQQNLAYHEHLPMQQNVCYGASRHSIKDRQHHKFTDCDIVSGESVDAPIVLVENVAYNRQMPLHQNMWYTSSSADTEDRFVYAYADVGTRHTHICHTLDPEPTMVENIAYGIST